MDFPARHQTPRPACSPGAEATAPSLSPSYPPDPARADGELASNVECCSLRFSKDVPGVIDGCSKLFADWRKSPGAADLKEICVDDGRCLERTHQLWSMGFPVGPSSGLNLAAAIDAAEDLPPDATIVTVFPDRMERYFSHKVFTELS